MDSNDIQALVDRAGANEVILQVENGELRFRCKPGAMSPQLLHDLKASRAQLLEHLGRRADSQRIEGTLPQFSVRVLPEAGRIPCFRKASWNGIKAGIVQVDSTNGPHWVVKVRGVVNLDALERACVVMTERHDALRASAFDTEDGPCLLVEPRVSFSLQRIDLTDTPSERREAEARDIASNLVWKTFDLSVAPLFRAFAILLGPREYVFGCVFHHFVVDRMSSDILKREVLEAYLAYSNLEPPSVLREPCVHYSEYLLSIENWLTTAGAAPHVSFWRERLAGVPAVTLPTSTRSTGASAGARLDIEIESQLAAGIFEAARVMRVTPFLLLLASQYVLLSRLTGLEDITVGTVIHGRETAPLQRVVGNLADRVYYRVNLSGNPRFAEVVLRVRANVLEAEPHQFVRSDILTRIRGSEGPLHAPIFNYLPANPIESLPPLWNKPDESVVGFGLAAPPALSIANPQMCYWLALNGTPTGIRGEFRFGGPVLPELSSAFISVLSQAVRWNRLRLRSFTLP